jgi:NADH-quinone oxidoreductase subunit L
MAIALVVLAIGSVLAGYIGLPHAMGHNVLAEWLHPAFEAPAPAGGGLAGMTIGDCVVSADPAAAQLPGMTTDNCAPAGDVALAADTAMLPAELTLAANAQAAEQPPAGEQAHDVAAEEAHDNTALEWTLMGVSTLIALMGIWLATFIWLQRPQIADSLAARFPGPYRLLLNKYYVDELYDVTVVQPVRIVSEDGLWRGMDARVVDGAVNGTGQVVGGMSAVMRLLQSGSVKTYAASTFFGAVLILAYYIWR